MIIRRPHAYWFLNETFAEKGGVVSATPSGCVAGDGTELPLPGLYVVDSEGGPVAMVSIQSVEEIVQMFEGPDAQNPSGSAQGSSVSKQVSIQVSGFMAQEGIT